MPNTILVTGATGTIGSILVEKLAAASQPARTLVRSGTSGSKPGDQPETCMIASERRVLVCAGSLLCGKLVSLEGGKQRF